MGELAGHIAAAGLRVGAVNPNLFQDPDYVLGSVTNPDAAIRAKAEEHLLECIEIARALGSTAQSLWLADGTNYPGQDDLIERRERMLDSLARVYAALPDEQEYLVEYKLFEPAFYATDLADWGSALLVCQRLGERARVLVDMGHHAQGVNVEQIVSILASEERLGGFHFNNRKYADDDLIVGSVNPFELFLVFCELVGGGRPLPRLTIDQSHNIEAKVEAMVMSVVNIQDAYARALIVDREALRAAGAAGDVLAGHQVLLDAYNTDVRPLCATRAGRSALRTIPSPRCARPGASRASPPSAGGTPMSATAELIASAADLWGSDGHAADPARAARARVEPAGRRPRRLELRRRQHLGQGLRRRSHGHRALRDVGQGLGQRPRHDRAAGLHGAAPAGGAAADRARRR